MEENNTEIKPDIRYIQELERHIESTKENVKYSLDRFDILIISLSSSSLALSIGFIKDVVKDFEKADHTLLKLSWLLFTVALIANLFSQVSSYFANKEEILISNNLIRAEKGNQLKGNQNEMEKRKKIFGITTDSLNLISLISITLGIILLILFSTKNI